MYYTHHNSTFSALSFTIFMISMAIVFAIAITLYIFQSLAYYKIAKNRNIENPWLVWIPVARYWTLGEIYNYYSHLDGMPRNNMHKIMLILGICSVIPVVGIVCAIANTVLEFIILYQIYKHLTPENSILFIILSIIIPVTMPFLLFAQRNKLDILTTTYNPY